MPPKLDIRLNPFTLAKPRVITPSTWVQALRPQAEASISNRKIRVIRCPAIRAAPQHALPAPKAQGRWYVYALSFAAYFSPATQ
jgi:hypothetical protein